MSKIYVDEIAPKTGGSMVDVQSVPHCTIYTSGSTTIPSGPATEITFNLVHKDTHSMADLPNNAIVIPAGFGGLYYISAAFRQNSFNAVRQIIYIYVNGSFVDFKEYPSYSANTGEYRIADIARMIYLNAGDSVTAAFYHNYGSDRTNYVSSYDTQRFQNHLSVTRIGGE